MNVVNPIFYQARLQPTTPAFVAPSGVLRFGQLAGIVQSISARLHAQGVRPGDVVSIAMETSVLHFLVMFALARLGAVSTGNFSKVAPAGARAAANRFGFTWVCHPEGTGAIEGIRSIVVDDTWLQPNPPGLEMPPLAAGGDDVWRIARSSGTTGTPKAIPWRHSGTLARLALNNSIAPVGPGQRVLPLMNFGAGYMLQMCMKHLYMGSTVVLSGASNLGELANVVDRYSVTHLATSPVALGGLLRGPMSDRRMMPSLQVVSLGGGLINEGLRRKARAAFSAALHSYYGSTEVGVVAMGDLSTFGRIADAVGVLVPWAQVEALGPNGETLPPGSEGELRVRTPLMNAEYHNDPELTGKVFREGWFYPGDVGCVTAGGILRIVGRTDDLLNLGGIKIQPARFEGTLSQIEEIEDLAVAPVADKEGRTRVGVGIVVAANADRARLIARCRAALPKRLPIVIAFLDEIPRNDMGKAVTRELIEKISAAMAAQPEGAEAAVESIS